MKNIIFIGMLFFALCTSAQVKRDADHVYSGQGNSVMDLQYRDNSSNNVSLAEADRLTAVSQSAEEDTRTILALKTNLLYDAVSWLNFSIEVPIKDNFSLLYYHQLPWWNWGKNNNEYCMRFLSIGLEGRWWFKTMLREATAKRVKRDRLIGHFVGVYAESGKWDFERKQDICYQGEHWSAGLSYGYTMPIGKRLNLELSVSAGYASIPHRGYEPAADYSELYHVPEKDGTWHYVGPTKAQVSLVLPFVVKNKKGGKL